MKEFLWLKVLPFNNDDDDIDDGKLMKSKCNKLKVQSKHNKLL